VSAASFACIATVRVVTCFHHQELGRRPSQPAYPGKVEQDKMGSLRGQRSGASVDPPFWRVSSFLTTLSNPYPATLTRALL
jgi:hypothetical protein